MRKLHLCAMFLVLASVSFGQGTQHDGIRARGSISNTQTYTLTGATPNVSIGNVFKTNNGGAVTVTNLLGGVDSQQITIVCGESNTIFQNNANIAITGGTNFTCVLNNAISFVYNAAGAVWVEIGGTGTGGGGGSTPPGAPSQSFQCNDGTGHFTACQSTPGGALLNGAIGGTPAFGPLGNEALKPGASDSVMYASVNGNDTNDGLSWGTAKLTIYGAMVALPGGNGTTNAGSGTIYVGPGTHAHPTAGVGIWFMGGGDPNYASPPAGWVKYVGGSIELIGVGATTPGILVGDVPYVPIVAGSAADRNHPSLWLTGAQGIFKPKNIAFVGSQRPIVLGECSNNSRTTVTCQVFGFTFDGNKAVVTRVDGNSGPTFDAPVATQVSIRNSTLAGTAGSVTPLVDNEANVLWGTATSQGGGLQLENTQLFYGGIKVLGNSQATLFSHNVDEYGDFVHPMPPTIWWTNWGALSAGAHWNTTRQDPVAVQPIIRIDTTCPYCPGPTVIGGFETNGVQGPATIFLNSPYYSSQAVNQTILGGKNGIINNYLFAESNLARRISGLVPVRFPNQSFANPSLYTSAGNTITLSQPDNFGGSGAVKVHTANVGGQTLLLSPAVAYTPASGDWIIGGFWIRQQTPFVQVPIQSGILSTGTATIGTTKAQGGPDQGDGEWQWNYTAKKVTANSAATTVQLSAGYNSNNDVFVYGPVLYIIPAAQITDDEALWFAQSMNAHDPACGIGSVCNTVGHPLQLAPDTFAKLGTPPDGTTTFCVDCQITNPCLSGGTGAQAKRLSGAWVCTDGNLNSNLFHSFFPGALTATWTADTWTVSRAVIVTRIQAQLRVAPAGCSTSAILRLTDGSTPVNLTLSAGVNDSGVIAQSYPAGTAFTSSIQTAAGGCTTSPGDANVVVQYRMQ